MKQFINQAGPWLRCFADNVVAALLAIMFVAFVAQIIGRYFFNYPTGSMSELTVVTWLWLVMWGSAFVLKESEEIRFDLIYSAVGPQARRVMGMVSAAAMVLLYGAALPASYSYVSFMKVERTNYLHIRLDLLYSIYVIFSIAIIVRYLWLLWQLLQGNELQDDEVVNSSSGL